MKLTRKLVAVSLVALIMLTAFVLLELTEGTISAITLAVALIVGFFPGMSLINWIKKLTGWEDAPALLLVYGICLAVGALGLWASGQLAAMEWTTANIVAIAGAFLSGAKLSYELFGRK